MKKLVLIILLLLPLAAALDCPRGIQNDAYPGDCKLYVDMDGNQICDLSESPPLTQQEKSYWGKDSYYLFEIIIILTIIYLLSYFILKKNIVLHRKIWNFLLLLSFLVTAITSLAILLRWNLGINSVFWHIEIGIIMILISVYHALWHLPYFKSYYK